MPSSCKFLAIVRGKEGTKKLKQREIPLGVFKRVPSGCADAITYLWSSPFSPPLSSSQKKYVKLLTITIVYYWKSSYLLSLSFGFCLLPYFSHCIKCLQSSDKWWSYFRANYRSIPSVFLCITKVTIFVFDHANHTHKKMKSSWVQCVSFLAQIAYRLKAET